jgi:C4-dicarboxylate-specific signal transduction histidine kinase
MPVWAIIVIVVVVVIILATLGFVLPRARERARVKRSERELGRRRDRAITENREEAEVRERRAEGAERRARIAEQEARVERSQAQLREEQAELHERGLADHDLVADDEREKFAGTSAAERAQEPGPSSGS